MVCSFNLELLSLIIIALFALYVAPYDPAAIDLESRLAPMSASHWLGTDHLGRYMLSRLIWGAWVSMGSVVVITLPC